MLDWVAERFQDALVSAELDPGLIHRQPERRQMRDQGVPGGPAQRHRGAARGTETPASAVGGPVNF